MSNNTFKINGDSISIYMEGWERVAFASIREDYIDEIQSVTWSYNNGYLRSKFGSLHSYIIKKWYGEELYNKIKSEGFIIEHMDNNGLNCMIENLTFLSWGENIAKGHTLDKYAADKRYIALNLFKDFKTQLYQMSIVFNHSAKLIWEEPSPATISIAYLLYDKDEDYECVINDARTILLEYNKHYTFSPHRLCFVDYRIEGSYGEQCPIELYNAYISGGHGHGVAYIVKKHMIENWKLTDNIKHFYLFGNPSITEEKK